MNRAEYLLACLAEECAELAQRATKAMRFGLTEVQPGQPLTNAQRVTYELGDLLGVVDMLESEEMIEAPTDEAIAAKAEKVEKFYAYSGSLGLVTASVSVGEAERLGAWIASMRDMAVGSDVSKKLSLMTAKALNGAPASEHALGLLRVYRARHPATGAGDGESPPRSIPAGSVAASEAQRFDDETWARSTLRTLDGYGAAAHTLPNTTPWQDARALLDAIRARFEASRTSDASPHASVLCEHGYYANETAHSCWQRPVEACPLCQGAGLRIAEDDPTKPTYACSCTRHTGNTRPRSETASLSEDELRFARHWLTWMPEENDKAAIALACLLRQRSETVRDRVAKPALEFKARIVVDSGPTFTIPVLLNAGESRTMFDVLHARDGVHALISFEAMPAVAGVPTGSDGT